jgi:hypothetical protein
MSSLPDLNQIDSKIKLMQTTADELQAMAADFPALARNMVRISASLKMLAINVSDVVELEE